MKLPFSHPAFQLCIALSLACSPFLSGQTVYPSSQQNQSSVSSKVVKTDQQWRQQLDNVSYRVTRQKGTENAYSGKHWNSKKDGVYVCKCCGQPLFDSKTKFESGTGWPSYFQPISSNAVLSVADLSNGMNRVESTCSRCDAHLGHVFDDGPRPTGLRYCMNSCALEFKNRMQVKLPVQQPNVPKRVASTGFESPQKLVEALSIAVAEKSVEKINKCICLQSVPENVRTRLAFAGVPFQGRDLASMNLLSEKDVPSVRAGYQYNVSVKGAIQVQFKDQSKSVLPYGELGGRYFLAFAVQANPVLDK